MDVVQTFWTDYKLPEWARISRTFNLLNSSEEHSENVVRTSLVCQGLKLLLLDLLIKQWKFQLPTGGLLHSTDPYAILVIPSARLVSDKNKLFRYCFELAGVPTQG